MDHHRSTNTKYQTLKHREIKEKGSKTFFLRPEVPGFWPSIGEVVTRETLNITIASPATQPPTEKRRKGGEGEREEFRERGR